MTALCSPELEVLIQAALGAQATSHSPSLVLGLGAGLYFEYGTSRRAENNPAVPSRTISGLSRTLDKDLAARLGAFTAGDSRQAVRDALKANALAFNLDRAPTTALMGMEMLAEHMSDWEALPDWQTCVHGIRHEIASTETLYRRTYLRFLKEIEHVLSRRELIEELSAVADEWDEFAQQLDSAVGDARRLEPASRSLRRLAFREEHFWGQVLHVVDQ